MKPKITVIIPAYNEAETIADVIAKIRTLHPDFSIIVINDGSGDDTASKALEAGAEVYSHPYNIGNGAAVKNGIRMAEADILVFMDGDGQHNPDDIGLLLEQLGDYDMVVGARSMTGHTSFTRAFGNRVYNWLASYVANFRIVDLTSGFRAVKADLAKEFIYLLPNTYSYPTTLTLGALRSGWSVKYVSIKMRKREKGKSNISIVKDGARFFMIITKICTLFSPLRVFLPVSFSMFLMGVLYYFYTFITQGRFTNMSAVLLTNAVVIFMMGLVSEQISQMRSERRLRSRVKKESDQKEY
ncbi:MAG: glycosyltransferase family 2 protein [Thermodesulfobacteriota bacterium]